MAAKLFQTILSKMEGTVDTLVGVADGEGQVIACTDLSRIGGEPMTLPAVGGYAFAVAKQNGMTFRAVGDDVHPEYVLFVGGVDAAAEKLAGVLAISLGSVREFYNENCSRADFLKNVVLDNIQPTDIGQKAKELRFLGERDRVAILLRLQETVTLASVDLIQSLFSERQKDFVINMNEHDILLIKEVSAGVESEHLEQLALSMSALLEGDLYLHCTAGIGTVVGDLKELSRSYKEAQIALEVGRIFRDEKSIISFNHLGVGRLIYQLPTNLCELYMKEVFNRGSIESLDQEILFTIQKFFENNLNVSETARKLFVHRNTLVYRLEKIKKLTGLDLREFEDAIVFKVALMVHKYLTTSPQI